MGSFIIVAEAILLGFQHYLVMLCTTVLIPSSLVPQMGGGNVRLIQGNVIFIQFLFYVLLSNNWLFTNQLFIISSQEEKAKVIQTLQFVAGLNTLTQTMFGTRLPAVIGGSYTFVPTTLSIILAGRYNDILDPVEVA